MLKKTLAAGLIALALPTIAFAYCDDMRRMPDGSLCPDGQIYDSEFAICVMAPTG